MKKLFNKFNIFINVWISLVINIVLSIVLVYVSTGALTWSAVLSGFAIAFPVSTLIVFFIPINKLGDFIATKCSLKPMGVPFICVSTLILAFIVGTFMSLFMIAVMAGKYVGYFTPAYWGSWLHVYPWALLSVYLSALVGRFSAFPLAVKVLGPPPAPENN